ncbi:MAG: tyrosine--tRNA ligase [Eubacteriales bacterium]|nr:tyrosine--tRNA ligase [Eubacteriales bacterium]MDD3200025.1 tyrosine--tRNA ligase [Eubacteriales bacterium]MDD4630008.1 tyrosine--tRNA ligase [Eubacteriales bacterium]
METVQDRNVFDVLMERGLIRQTTHEEEIRELLGKEKVIFYIGFDPTADSLHVGHFMQIIVMMYMQKYGHIPIVLIGGGTTLVGDPSGRTDMRQMITKEAIRENGDKFKKTFSKFIDFSDGKAFIDNNADWLLELNYLDFIRNIGRHFSVNRMLTAECFKQRLETGLSFLEFNYMLMQSYDFLELHRRYGCKMQFGGDDQWSNILYGVDLVRREMGDQVYGMTFALLTTSEGKKMGKTQKGALWLDPEKTSPYEFYQYWRNVEDADVKTCLSMLTFLPMDEVNRLSSLKDAEINTAKEILAFEVTKMVHGEEEAQKAQDAARALFAGGGNLDDVPKTKMPASKFDGEGMGIVSLIAELKLVSSKGDGFRTIEQGGLSIDDVKVTHTKLMITKDMFKDGKILIKKGKKTFHLVELI